MAFYWGRAAHSVNHYVLLGMFICSFDSYLFRFRGRVVGFDCTSSWSSLPVTFANARVHMYILLKIKGTYHSMSNYIDSAKTATMYFYNFICAYNCASIASSSEPLGSQDVLLVYTCSGVRPSVRSSSVLISETASPSKAKLHLEHSLEGC